MGRFLIVVVWLLIIVGAFIIGWSSGSVVLDDFLRLLDQLKR